MRVDRRQIEIGLAWAAFAAGLVLALSVMQRGVWLDEFWTLMATDPSQTPAMFWETMSKDVHPVLHYGLMYVVRSAGIEDVAALRAFNLLGLPLAFAAGWHAWRAGALDARQACVLLAVAASSPMFLGELAEIRTYFLLFCASIAVTLVWRVLMIRLQRGEGAGAGDLAMWGICLAVFVNLHYFATLLGGILTLGLIASLRDRRAISIALVSFAAAVPALILLSAQLVHMDTRIVAWILTGRVDAVFALGDNVWSASGQNVFALACAVVALLFLAGDRSQWRASRHDLILLGLILVYCAALVVANAIRPVIIDRYLVAVGGAIAVLIAAVAAHPRLPAWSVVAICLFAMLVQFRGWHSGQFNTPGWSESARFVADKAAACPDTRVLIQPDLSGDDLGAYLATLRVGHHYYAERMGFTIEDAPLSRDITPAGPCPTILWAEDKATPGHVGATEALTNVGLKAGRPAEAYRVGTATVIIVSPPG